MERELAVFRLYYIKRLKVSGFLRNFRVRVTSGWASGGF
jgi:hypothetical protein